MGLNNDIVNIWHLNEIAGTDVLDSVGSNDGIADGAVIDTDNQLLGAACRYFDGIDDSIDIPFSSEDTEGSVGVFFQMPSMVGEQTFFMFTNGTNNGDLIGIRVYLGNVDIIVRGESTTHILCHVGSVSVDNYHCVLFTVDATGNKIYLDGVLKTPTYTTGDADSTEWFDDLNLSGAFAVLTIGARDTGTSLSTYYGGQLDELVRWNKAKTAADALEWWNGGAGVELELELAEDNPRAPRRLLLLLNRGKRK